MIDRQAETEGARGNEPAEQEARRVVLVKPGDVLVIGNLGDAFLGNWELLREATEKMKAATGMPIVCCYQDVSVSTTAAELIELLDWAHLQADSREAGVPEDQSTYVYREVAEHIADVITGGPAPTLVALRDYVRRGEADASSELSRSVWRDVRMRLDELSRGPGR